MNDDIKKQGGYQVYTYKGVPIHQCEKLEDQRVYAINTQWIGVKAFDPEEHAAALEKEARLVNRLKRIPREIARRLSNAWQSLKGVEWD